MPRATVITHHYLAMALECLACFVVTPSLFGNGVGMLGWFANAVVTVRCSVTALALSPSLYFISLVFLVLPYGPPTL